MLQMHFTVDKRINNTRSLVKGGLILRLKDIENIANNIYKIDENSFWEKINYNQNRQTWRKQMK